MNCKGCDCASKAQYLPVPAGFFEVWPDGSGGYAVNQLSAIRFRQGVEAVAVEYLDMGGIPVLGVLHEPSATVYEFSEYDSGWGEVRRYPLAVWVEEFCR